jgi:co-chaperonin GroES (HSP10)
MEILTDYYIVTIDKLYDDSETPNGIVTLNSAYIKDAEDDENRFVHKRIYGEVIGCPAEFSAEEIVELIDPGLPAPKRFVSADYLQMRANQGYDGRVYKKDRSYYPSTFDEYEFTSLADVAKRTNIKKGQRAYFDYKSTEPENFLGKFRGKDMYKIRVDEIYCTVDFHRKILSGGGSKAPRFKMIPKINMQGGWVLVEPDMETWEEITTPSGIIMKPNPEVKDLRAKVAHIAFRHDVRRGDRIIFMKHADAIMNVEGTPYYCMHDSDILCKY